MTGVPASTISEGNRLAIFQTLTANSAPMSVEQQKPSYTDIKEKFAMGAAKSLDDIDVRAFWPSMFDGAKTGQHVPSSGLTAQ